MIRKPLIIAFALCGCVVSPTSAPGGLAVYRIQAVDAAAPPAQGETEIVVVTTGVDGTARPGAACVARSVFARTEFAAPARLLVAHYGAASPEIEIRCRDADGEGSVSVAPRLAGAQGLGGWPAIGVSVNSGGGVGVGMGWRGGSVATGVPMVLYPEARVVIN